MNKLETKEAIRILSELHYQCCQADNIFCTDVTGARCEAVDMAITTLEKQIPKPPKSIKEDYNEYMDLYCPTCGHGVGMYDAETGYSYMYNESNPRMCAKCGQLLFAKLEGE